MCLLLRYKMRLCQRVLICYKFRWYYQYVSLIPLMLLALSLMNIGKFACNYSYMERGDVWLELVRKVSKNVTFPRAAVCDYISVLEDQSILDVEALKDAPLDTSHIKSGGEYIPPDCKPLFSAAVIVPYRDRDKQLRDFLTHIHIFLKRQNIHYRIYVVEQDDVRPFNRAKLLNIGSVKAIHHGFPCIILHDVDLLPFVSNNIYACTKSPRHMSTSIDLYRFTLTYNELFGGAVSLLSEQFVAANGMSNSYYGWGAEDDDFYERLSRIGLTPVRFHPSVSAYVMMKHHKALPSPERKFLLAQAPQRFAIDGLNSLNYVEKATKLHPLFTHVIVQL